VRVYRDVLWLPTHAPHRTNSTGCVGARSSPCATSQDLAQALQFECRPRLHRRFGCGTGLDRVSRIAKRRRADSGIPNARIRSTVVPSTDYRELVCTMGRDLSAAREAVWRRITRACSGWARETADGARGRDAGELLTMANTFRGPRRRHSPDSLSELRKRCSTTRTCAQAPPPLQNRSHEQINPDLVCTTV